MNIPRGGVYLSTGATQLDRHSTLSAYMVMAGSRDPFAITTVSAVGSTRVRRSVVFRAHAECNDFGYYGG